MNVSIPLVKVCACTKKGPIAYDVSNITRLPAKPKLFSLAMPRVHGLESFHGSSEQSIRRPDSFPITIKGWNEPCLLSLISNGTNPGEAVTGPLGDLSEHEASQVSVGRLNSMTSPHPSQCNLRQTRPVLAQHLLLLVFVRQRTSAAPNREHLEEVTEGRTETLVG